MSVGAKGRGKFPTRNDKKIVGGIAGICANLSNRAAGRRGWGGLKSNGDQGAVITSPLKIRGVGVIKLTCVLSGERGRTNTSEGTESDGVQTCGFNSSITFRGSAQQGRESPKKGK